MTTQRQKANRGVSGGDNIACDNRTEYTNIRDTGGQYWERQEDDGDEAKVVQCSLFTLSNQPHNNIYINSLFSVPEHTCKQREAGGQCEERERF